MRLNNTKTARPRHSFLVGGGGLLQSLLAGRGGLLVGRGGGGLLAGRGGGGLLAASRSGGLLVLHRHLLVPIYSILLEVGFPIELALPYRPFEGHEIPPHGHFGEPLTSFEVEAEDVEVRHVHLDNPKAFRLLDMIHATGLWICGRYTCVSKDGFECFMCF
jgi:hypothetical protein